MEKIISTEQKPANPNDLRRKMNNIIQYGSLQDLIDFVESGNDVDQVDWEGRTALQMMSAKGDKAAIEFLISKGADLNKIFMFQERIPKTALDAAIETRRTEIQKILMSHGAKMASEL